MHFVAGHLVRRGTELVSAQFKDPEKQPEQISGALAACLALTGLVFGFAMFAVSFL
jgi:multisubunit Na+/H+ antiporter MnhC subunit